MEIIPWLRTHRLSTAIFGSPSGLQSALFLLYEMDASFSRTVMFNDKVFMYHPFVRESRSGAQ